jgi:phosphatidylserine synthase
MRKIPESAENPIDNLNIDLVDSICPFFKNIGMTPNGITTLSLIFGLLAIYFLYHRKPILFAVSYYVSYLFDVMDGHFARKYNMVSKGGDIYDHVKDITVIICLVYVLLARISISKKDKICFAIGMGILSFLMTAQLGCQEKLYPKSESDTLSFSKYLCVGNANDTIKFTRYFGCATWVIILIIWILYLLSAEKKQ